MDDLKTLEALAARARDEAPPAMDVADAVRLRLRAGHAVRLLPLSLVAAGTALAAAVLLALAIHSLASAGTDPIAALYPTIEVGLS